MWFGLLRDLGWLDSKDGGWEIHDYWEHAPDYVRKRLAREAKRQIDGANVSNLVYSGGHKGPTADNGGQRRTTADNVRPNEAEPSPINLSENPNTENTLEPTAATCGNVDKSAKESVQTHEEEGEEEESETLVPLKLQTVSARGRGGGLQALGIVMPRATGEWLYETFREGSGSADGLTWSQVGHFVAAGMTMKQAHECLDAWKRTPHKGTAGAHAYALLWNVLTSEQREKAKCFKAERASEHAR